MLLLLCLACSDGDPPDGPEADTAEGGGPLEHIDTPYELPHDYDAKVVGSYAGEYIGGALRVVNGEVLVLTANRDYMQVLSPNARGVVPLSAVTAWRVPLPAGAFSFGPCGDADADGREDIAFIAENLDNSRGSGTAPFPTAWLGRPPPPC